MSTSSAPTAVSIAISLAEDPRIHCKKWLQQVEALLTMLARGIFQNGLMFFDIMLTCTQYRAKHGHSRRTPKLPPNPLITATPAEVEYFKREKESYSAYVTAIDAARIALLDSVGKDIRDALEDPVSGFKDLRIGTIVNYVVTNYGTITEDDVDKVDALLATPYDPATDLSAYIANMSARFALLDSYGESKSERDKLRLLDTALSTDVATAAAIQAGKYDAANADMKRTFKWAAKHAIKATPALRSSTTSTSGLLNLSQGIPAMTLTGNPAVDTAMLQYHTALLAHRQDPFAGAAAATPVHPQSNGPSAVPPSNGACLYCWAHGWRFDHAGNGCFDLQKLPDGVSKAKKMAAVNPHVQVDGVWGCDAVQASNSTASRRNSGNKRQRNGNRGGARNASVAATAGEA